jgi:sigma-B regulation protein RsbU (phosphoserine phosphatase)
MQASSEKILVIDADDRARKMLCNYLIGRGYYVYAANCLAEACVCIGKERPDLVFSDLDESALQNLNRVLNSNNFFTPVVGMAQTKDAKKVVGALRAGAYDFVLKPFDDMGCIDSVVNKLFERVRLYRLNQRYRQELEDTNKELSNGIAELKADQNAGLKVQMKMLPERDQSIESIAFDHLIKPSLFLSGDFLDYFRLDRDRVLFYLADVSGHGASSAFVTVLLKNLTNRLLRNLRRGSSDDLSFPDKFLHRVNSELIETKLGKHLTMFVGIIHLRENTLTYSVAAHYPMPVMKTAEKTVYMEGSGMPAGLFDVPEFNTYKIPLPSQFQIVLFSDGILEIMKEKSLDEKEQRLLEVITEAGQTIDCLSDVFGLNGISDLPDDIAILLVSEVNSKNVQL